MLASMSLGDGMHLCGLFQQLTHFGVGRLREIAIPNADGIERLWGAGANCLISFVLELGTRLESADRHCNDDACRSLLPQARNSGAHRRAGGQAIIDKDDDVATHRAGRPAAAVDAFTPLKFRLLLD